MSMALACQEREREPDWSPYQDPRQLEVGWAGLDSLANIRQSKFLKAQSSYPLAIELNYGEVQTNPSGSSLNHTGNENFGLTG